ncbi:MAG: hypothetical protein KAH48_05395 [Chlorobi bacterium]|nr:hypothetical protein [Chlorobiota bacterium]
MSFWHCWGDDLAVCAGMAEGVAENMGESSEGKIFFTGEEKNHPLTPSLAGGGTRP